MPKATVFVMLILLALVLVVSYQQCAPTQFQQMQDEMGLEKSQDSTGQAGSDKQPCSELIELDEARIERQEEAVAYPCPATLQGEACYLVCHVPPGNPANRHTILTSASGREAHLRHHDDGREISQDADGPCVRLDENGTEIPTAEQVCVDAGPETEE